MKDIIGLRYGSLVVSSVMTFEERLAYFGEPGRSCGRCVYVACDCGRTDVACIMSHLRTGRVKSCGCAGSAPRKRTKNPSSLPASWSAISRSEQARKRCESRMSNEEYARYRIANMANDFRRKLQEEDDVFAGI